MGLGLNINLGISPLSIPTSSTPIISDWILSTGQWRDIGFWVDGENWID